MPQNDSPTTGDRPLAVVPDRPTLPLLLISRADGDLIAIRDADVDVTVAMFGAAAAHYAQTGEPGKAVAADAMLGWLTGDAPAQSISEALGRLGAVAA